MIRGISIAALLGLLVLVLYLPSAYPPQRFLHQLRTDHAATVQFWGEAAAHDLLDTALDRQRNVQDVAPIPDAYDAPSTERVNGAVAQEMSSVNERLFNSPYFRSLDAMLLLATYRGSLALKWLFWLALFPMAVMVDSLVLRRVKALEFAHHDPEIFAVLACAAIITACATILFLVLPVSLHPVLLPLAPVLACTLAARATSSYHASP
ncbi:DUF4400 domain-containing protein [Xanthomonas arboricola]|uniref:DUF4400 domain-containing protein n=1 Tax=Xanthomonas arboricola TaxID=56448 RepID=UPI000CEE25FD|nr:DUF4400 domain-containing protein [Xanthomonas arboricola]PPT46462.1 hypothetical protein XarjCFBP7652_17695 [Xanthomonas arboricola]